MTPDDIIQLWRSTVATTLGLTSIVEGDYGPELAAKSDPWAAFRVSGAERIWEPTSVGLAVLDEPTRLDIELLYARKRVAGEESASTVRLLLDTLATALNGEPPTWDTSTSIVWCRCETFRYGTELEQVTDTWASGTIGLSILYCA